MAEHNTRIAGQGGTQHGGVGRAVLLEAHQGLDHAAAPYLVIVLAYEVFLAADVEAAHHAGQQPGLVRGGHVDTRLHNLGRSRPGGVQLHLGHAVMQKIHGQIGHELFLY